MTHETLTARLLDVFDALDLACAHVATQSPSDIASLVEQAPERIGGIVLLAPARIDPTPFTPHAKKVLYIAPSDGTLSRTAAAVRPRLDHAKHAVLDGYSAESWSDIAVDRPDIADLITAHLDGVDQRDAYAGEELRGEVAGIRYHVCGSGPPLVLTPLAFAPSQWQSILPKLIRHFRVIALSGPHFGMLALLEQRAALTGWQQMCRTVFEGLDLKTGDHVLDVGCGSGAVARQFVQQTGGQNPLTAIDLSPYLLEEARYCAIAAGLGDMITFTHASAEALPFANDHFDAAFTVTVLEECHARRAVDELVRVVKPGGRVAIIVRAVDLPQWWNMPISADIRAKIAAPAASVGPDGVATAEIYQVASAAGLELLRLYPYIVASEQPDGPVFEFPEAHALAQLTAHEQAAFYEAKAQASADGTLFVTRGHHCLIGKVPM